MELQIAFFAQIIVGLVLCLPTLFATMARLPFGGGEPGSPRPRTIMGRGKYAFYAA